MNEKGAELYGHAAGVANPARGCKRKYAAAAQGARTAGAGTDVQPCAELNRHSLTVLPLGEENLAKAVVARMSDLMVNKNILGSRFQACSQSTELLFAVLAGQNRGGLD